MRVVTPSDNIQTLAGLTALEKHYKPLVPVESGGLGCVCGSHYDPIHAKPILGVLAATLAAVPSTRTVIFISEKSGFLGIPNTMEGLTALMHEKCRELHREPAPLIAAMRTELLNNDQKGMVGRLLGGLHREIAGRVVPTLPPNRRTPLSSSAYTASPHAEFARALDDGLDRLSSHYLNLLCTTEQPDALTAYNWIRSDVLFEATLQKANEGKFGAAAELFCDRSVTLGGDLRRRDEKFAKLCAALYGAHSRPMLVAGRGTMHLPSMKHAMNATDIPFEVSTCGIEPFNELPGRPALATQAMVGSPTVPERDVLVHQAKLDILAELAIEYDDRAYMAQHDTAQPHVSRIQKRNAYQIGFAVMPDEHIEAAFNRLEGLTERSEIDRVIAIVRIAALDHRSPQFPAAW